MWQPFTRSVCCFLLKESESESEVSQNFSECSPFYLQLIRCEVGQCFKSLFTALGTGWCFQGGPSVKNLPSNARDVRDIGLIPASGRSPGEGQGNPLQYCCLENPMNRGAWRATVYWVPKNRLKSGRYFKYFQELKKDPFY